MYAYTHCYGRLARYWNGLMHIEQNVGSLVTCIERARGRLLAYYQTNLFSNICPQKESEPLVPLCMANCVKGWLLAYHRAPTRLGGLAGVREMGLP